MAIVAAVVAIVVVIGVARSTGGDGHGVRSQPAGVGSAEAGSAAPSAGTGSAGANGDVAPALRGLVGSGCADYAAAVPTGAGSIPSMPAESLTAALTANPLLATFAHGVSGDLNHQMSLTGTLSSGQFTVFAPIDSAFAKVPAATLQKVTLSASSLRKVLSHLIVAGQLSPSQVVGSHVTLAGDPIAVTSSGGQLTVGPAQVVCGGLRAANATIYLIDAVPSLRG